MTAAVPPPASPRASRPSEPRAAAGDEVNASFPALNRTKRSLAVDLKPPEGQAIVPDLARTRPKARDHARLPVPV